MENVKAIKSRTLIVHGERVEITNNTIVKTCDWYAQNALACIEEAANGESPVNNLEKYTLEKLKDYHKFNNGCFIAGIWFWQRAYFIQTGLSIPLIAN